MKKLVLSIFIVAVSVAAILIAPKASAQTPVGIGQMVVTNTSTTVPVPLSSNTLLFTTATIRGIRFHQITNTSAVNIGFNNSTNGWQGATIDPGGSIYFPARPSTVYNLANIWLDVTTANDGVVIYYER